MKFFLPCLLVLIVIIALSYGYGTQKSTLVVTVYLDLTVARDSSSRPGFGQILELNTSVAVVKWPETANEKVDVNPRYAFNETRSKPVQFAVSVYLDEKNNTVLTPNLTITGGYSAVVRTTFSSIDQGTHNLTISVYVLGYEDNKDQTTMFITIP
jgi:hypothetical protein